MVEFLALAADTGVESPILRTFKLMVSVFLSALPTGLLMIGVIVASAIITLFHEGVPASGIR